MSKVLDKLNTCAAKRYIAAGVRTDIQKLLLEFEKTPSVRYDDFAAVWCKMQFSFIYAGRKSFDELYEFTEELLRIAKDFWLPPTRNSKFKFQIGGLYLIYGLYSKQPTRDLVKVRITVDDMLKLNIFAADIADDGHHDACYILATLFSIRAFDFCVSPYQYGMEKKFRKYFELDSSLKEHIAGVDSSWTVNLNTDILSNLDKVLKEYNQLKCQLNGPLNTPPQVLDYVDGDIANKLKNKLSECEETEQEIRKLEINESEPCSSTIKHKPSRWLRSTSSAHSLNSLGLMAGNRESDSTSDDEDEEDEEDGNDEIALNMPSLQCE